MSLKLAACAVLLTAGAVTPVSAHHSAEAAYDINKTVTFEGTLQRIDWINPHVLFHVVQTGPGARTTAWTVEANPPAWWRRAGLAKKDFDGAIGKKVTVEGWPGRNGRKIAYFQVLNFPDGRHISFKRASR